MTATRSSSALLAAALALAATNLAVTGQAATAQSVEDRARAAAAASRARTGDSQALRETLITPGLSGQPINTVDGAHSFTSRLACQTTRALLEMLVQPSSTGDLGMVRISQDRDFDGGFDSVSTLSVPVSGICANGVIACQPGSWDQCRFFRWDVDPAKTIRLVEADMPELAGCYCINNSCGSGLAWTNLAAILGDLGGGVVGALTTADPRIGVAQAQIDGPLIRYVGAQASACAVDPTLPQTGYRANPVAMAGDAAAMAAGNSIFQAVAASPAGDGKAEQTNRCTIERAVTLDQSDIDSVATVSGPVSQVSSCGEGCRRYRIGGDGSCGAPALYTATVDVRKPDRLVSARLTQMWAEDWLQARIDGVAVASAGKRSWFDDGLPAGDCEVSGDFAAAPMIDFTDAARAGPASVTLRNWAGGSQRDGWADIEIRIDPGCRSSEQLVDLCAGYAADPLCRLTAETVDGVDTVRNGIATGLRPLPQTRLFGSDSCTLQLTRDFFLKDRRYACRIDRGSAPEPDLSRGAYILDHSTETLLADRQTKADGHVMTSTRPFALPDRGTVPACEAICRTQAPKANSDAAPAGVVASQQVQPTGIETFYHVCSSDNVCPAGPGETVVAGCGCLDDFPEAAVMMQTVRLGGADLVCTAADR